MAIKFFNINSGEEKTVDTEPLIAAFFNSGDQHVNAQLGQDFGWRLAPETLARMKEIMSDQALMARIASTFQLPYDAVGKTDIVRWISLEDARKEAQKQQAVKGKFEQQYQEQVREIEQGKEKIDSSNKTDSVKQGDSAKIKGSNNNRQEK